MKTVIHPTQFIPRSLGFTIIGGWLVILSKCLAMPSLFTRFSIPVHPAWVIVPTLIIATLATIVSLAHDWRKDYRPSRRTPQLLPSSVA